VSMRRLLVLTGAVTLLGAAGVFLYAAPGDGAGQGAADALFTRCDTNGDGQIARDEFRGADQAFDRLDANDDGVITREEAAAAPAGGPQAGPGGQGGRGAGRMAMDPAQRWQQMLQRFDADGDGRLSAEEFQGAPRIFTMLDQDGDGVVTEAEGTRFGPGGQGGPGAGAGRGGPLGQPRRGFDFQQMLQRLDRDGDGRISQDEWPGREEMFARLDADGNGVITEEEVQAIRQQQRPERPNLILTLIRVMDQNGDGQVSAEEWADFHAQADADEDAMLTQDEFTKKVQEILRPKEEAAPAEEN